VGHVTGSLTYVDRGTWPTVLWRAAHADRVTTARRGPRSPPRSAPRAETATGASVLVAFFDDRDSWPTVAVGVKLDPYDAADGAGVVVGDAVAVGAGAAALLSPSSSASSPCSVVVGVAAEGVRRAGATAARTTAVAADGFTVLAGMEPFAAAGATAAGAGAMTVFTTRTTQTFFSSFEPVAQRAKLAGAAATGALGGTNATGFWSEADDDTPP
jgi:hypothetical protein